ncbi:hypothetical protein [Mycobacterium gordonae]|uniref:hypothetical protein n=1 Tax=Mycobacterium gordonae TaxID=1778 RepID=UPI0008489557|nr:hypothetical protein [Mycobacterium gordonae]MCV7005658.1 hypothetical protein [Mycobacterium gordonae]ODR23541.1 hypothetical protein BHQ23_04585 [Mycobacterium gordonae]
MPDVRTLRGIELVRLGRWPAKTGIMRTTTQDLVSAIEAFNAGVVHRPALKLGHVEPLGEGDPAVGYVDAMRLSADGQALLADFVGVPAKLAEIMQYAYPQRSIEAAYDFRDQDGREWPMVILAVALLGAHGPAVTSLKSLADVEDLYAARARDCAVKVAAARRRRTQLTSKGIR